jgi:cysteine desulfurase
MLAKEIPCPRRYFDWAAAAVPRAVSGGYSPYGNPSSPHTEGKLAREALEEARSRCAGALGVPVKTIYFTSGGSESNAIVLYSRLLAKHGARILFSAVEHPSVRETCHILERLGKQTGVIPVDSNGRVTEALLEKTLEKYQDARFAAIMAVNNEVGSVMDMEKLCAILRRRENPPMHIHCDIVQAAGKIPMDLVRWDIDSAAISAHKLGGPRGIGLLYLRRPLESIYAGGGQERNIRGGTENTAGALALAECLEFHAAAEAVKTEFEKADFRWNKLIRALKAIDRCSLIPEDRKAGDTRFSPYILQTAFEDIPGEVLVRALDDMGFAVSTGSACSSASPDRPVLNAMGIDPQKRLGGIRLSQGWLTTEEDIDALTGAIKEVLEYL